MHVAVMCGTLNTLSGEGMMRGCSVCGYVSA